jgi:Conjugal transfer protein TraD
MAERKADTRAKILLGGLVVKAGLAEEDSAVILGILVEAAGALGGPDGELVRRRFRRAGDQAFADSGAGSYSRNSAAAR